MNFKTIKILIFLFLVGFFSNCSIIEETEIIPTLIGKGNLMGSENIAQQNIVISNEVSWLDLISQMDTYNSYSSGFTETDIEFETYMLVAVFDQIYGNGGHGLEINSIYENDTEIKIDVEKVNPAGDATCVISQPYYIVKIPKSNKIVVFN